MLTITREGNIITVVETLYSFTRTTRKTVRYNMDNWTRQVNDNPWQPMNDADRHWVIKHYLPKVK